MNEQRNRWSNSLCDLQPSLCVLVWISPGKLCWEPRTRLGGFHQVAFLLLEGYLIPQASLVLDSPSQPQIHNPWNSVHVPPQHLGRKAAKASPPLSGSPAPISPGPPLIPPATLPLSDPSTMGSFEEWACGCSRVPGDANSLLSLTLLVLGAQVDVFLINEAFVLHHKTIEEYPSHSNELCHKVNYEMTFPGSRQRRPGVQASPDNWLPEILAEENKDLGGSSQRGI